MTKRGTVQKDTSMGDGVVAVEGRQYAFQLVGTWISEMPPRLGMPVDVTFNDNGAPAAIVAVPESQIAREQARAALNVASQHGTVLAGSLRQRFGVGVLVAEALLLAGFFVLPSATLAFGIKAFTAWDLIGFNTSTMSANDHGVLSLLAIVCLFAPLAVPLLKAWWARFLYAAPLVFSVGALGFVVYQLTETSREASRAVTDTFGSSFGRQVASQTPSLVHPGFGIAVVLAASAYLATHARSKTAQAH